MFISLKVCRDFLDVFRVCGGSLTFQKEIPRLCVKVIYGGGSTYVSRFLQLIYGLTLTKWLI